MTSSSGCSAPHVAAREVDGASLVELILLRDVRLLLNEELDDLLVTSFGGEHQARPPRAVWLVDVEGGVLLHKVLNAPQVPLFAGSVRVSYCFIRHGSSVCEVIE